MDAHEHQELAQRLHMDDALLDFSQPLRFVIGEEHDFCLQENDTGALIVTLSCPLQSWETDKLQSMLEDCSCLKAKELNYSIGYTADQVHFLVCLGTDPTALAVENTLLQLIRLKQHYFLAQ